MQQQETFPLRNLLTLASSLGIWASHSATAVAPGGPDVSRKVYDVAAWPDFPPDFVCFGDNGNPSRSRTEEGLTLSQCDGIGPEVFKIIGRELGIDFLVSPSAEVHLLNGTHVEANLLQIQRGEMYLSVSLYAIVESRLDYVDFIDFLQHRVVFLTCAPRKIFSEYMEWPFTTVASAVLLMIAAIFPIVLLGIRALFAMPKSGLALMLLRVFLSQPGAHKLATR